MSAAMKLSCPEYYLVGASFEEKLLFLRKVGFDAVEVSNQDLRSRRGTILEALRNQAVAVSALWGLVRGCASSSVEKRQAAIEDLEFAFEFAAECGAGKVVCIDHCLAPGEDAGSAMKHFRESARQAAEAAAKLGVVLAVEPLSWRDRAMIAHTEDGLRLCREVPSPGLRLNLDTYHMAVGGEDPVKSFDRGLPYAAHIHFSDYVPPPTNPKRPLPGEGQVDFEGCIAVLRKHGYSGFICVEGTSLRPGPPDAQLGATVKYVRALLAS